MLITINLNKLLKGGCFLSKIVPETYILVIIFCACLKRNVSCNFYLLAKKKTPKTKNQMMITKLHNHLNETLVQAIDCSLSSNQYFLAIEYTRNNPVKKPRNMILLHLFPLHFFKIFNRVGLSWTFLDYFDLLQKKSSV